MFGMALLSLLVASALANFARRKSVKTILSILPLKVDPPTALEAMSRYPCKVSGCYRCRHETSERFNLVISMDRARTSPGTRNEAHCGNLNHLWLAMHNPCSAWDGFEMIDMYWNCTSFSE